MQILNSDTSDAISAWESLVASLVADGWQLDLAEVAPVVTAETEESTQS